MRDLIGAPAAAVWPRLALLVMAALLLLAAAGWSARFALRIGRPHAARLRDRLVNWAAPRNGFVSRTVVSLFDPARPESAGLLLAALLLLGGGWGFIELLENVVARDPLVLIDRAVFSALQALRTGWLDRVMVAVTGLGGAAVTVPVIVAVALWLAWKRLWRTLAYWLAAVGFGRVLVWVLKTAIARPRPNAVYSGAVGQFSFPSGHTASSMVLYGFLAFLLARGKPIAQKLWIGLAAAAIVLSIAFSRLYLGAHWMSDVLASITLGTAWVALLAIAYTHHAQAVRLPTRMLWLVAGATLLVAGAVNVVRGQAADLERYAPAPTAAPVDLPDWREGGWRQLPATRTDLEGEAREPFSVQWAGRVDTLRAAMAAAGWQPAESWDPGTALGWLLPDPAIAQFPLLPRFDRGVLPALSWIKVERPDHRLVLRLWRSGRATAAGGGAPQPIWIGSVSRETPRPMAGFLHWVRTERDFDAALQSLLRSLRERALQLNLRTPSDRPLALIWHCVTPSCAEAPATALPR